MSGEHQLSFSIAHHLLFRLIQPELATGLKFPLFEFAKCLGRGHFSLPFRDHEISAVLVMGETIWDVQSNPQFPCVRLDGAIR